VNRVLAVGHKDRAVSSSHDVSFRVSCCDAVFVKDL
jgi:hypothetical protein